MNQMVFDVATMESKSAILTRASRVVAVAKGFKLGCLQKRLRYLRNPKSEHECVTAHQVTSSLKVRRGLTSQ
jgi:hypothetical protein